jgi:hypothetical protein
MEALTALAVELQPLQRFLLLANHEMRLHRTVKSESKYSTCHLPPICFVRILVLCTTKTLILLFLSELTKLRL